MNSPTTLNDPIARRLPFFYGWLMLPIAMIAMILTSPGQTYGVSVFNPSFRTELNLSHSLLTGAYMLGTLLASIPQAYIGALMDRWGIRRTMTAVTIIFGFACLFTSQVRNLPMLFFAFLFLRMFGQGALSLLAGNTLAMWFHDRLGRVSGIMNVGAAAAVGLVPGLILSLINGVGWRWAYAILGGIVWLILLPLLATLFRNRPEDVGQLPDGLRTAKVESEIMRENGRSFTLPAAMRTRAYWITVALAVAYSMIITGITFNIIPLFESHGLTEAMATASFATMATALAITQIIGGYLADKVPLNWLAFISALGLTAGVYLLLPMQSMAQAHLFALCIGIGQGFLGAVQSTLWVRYYGRLHLGKIRGSIATAGVAASSLGPFVMGATFDLFGSYNTSLWIFIIFLLPLIIAAPFATQPQNSAHR
ncbi:MAG: MFS transporter [Ardenticatenaceae bacterium]|nr:MFS transporter [Ardenticatenaceae bacterium]